MKKLQKKIILAIIFAGYRESSLGIFQCLIFFLEIEDVCKYMAIQIVLKCTNGLMRCDWFHKNENMKSIQALGLRNLNVPLT